MMRLVLLHEREQLVLPFGAPVSALRISKFVAIQRRARSKSTRCFDNRYEMQRLTLTHELGSLAQPEQLPTGSDLLGVRLVTLRVMCLVDRRVIQSHRNSRMDASDKPYPTLLNAHGKSGDRVAMGQQKCSDGRHGPQDPFKLLKRATYPHASEGSVIVSPMLIRHVVTPLQAFSDGPSGILSRHH
jgi:hypothetical protein